MQPKYLPAIITTNPQANPSKLEIKIDQLVALRQLYGLTEEEIEIVEGNNK